jgi:hypothetical protein
MEVNTIILPTLTTTQTFQSFLSMISMIRIKIMAEALMMRQNYLQATTELQNPKANQL